MSVPIMVPAFAVVAAVLAFAWWWTQRNRVTPQPISMVAQRVHFPNGGVRLSDVTTSLVNLRNPEEIVIPFNEAVLVIDYPLSHPAAIELSAALAVGFTRQELVRAVCEEYANVYEVEDTTASTKAIPREDRTTLKNRNRTDGAYGIYGHDLEDLTLTSLRWDRGDDGTIRIELFVES
ncbi:MAG TPA: hypothetical protein VGM90_01005 [Kofleriaceae bacterium]